MCEYDIGENSDLILNSDLNKKKEVLHYVICWIKLHGIEV